MSFVDSLTISIALQALPTSDTIRIWAPSSGDSLQKKRSDTTSELDPIDPSNALELYLADRGGNLAEATIRSHRSRLSTFVEWLDDRGIDNLNDLTGRIVKEYQLHRSEESGWATVTEKTQMDTVRVFVRWAEGIEAVENDLSPRVQSPDLGEGDNVRHEELDSATATAVLTNLEKFHYCTLPHVTLALMWHTMCRKGAVRSLDVDDYDARDKHIQFVHRPETGTPLKKQEKPERYVAISDSMAEAHQRLQEIWVPPSDD